MQLLIFSVLLLTMHRTLTRKGVLRFYAYTDFFGKCTPTSTPYV